MDLAHLMEPSAGLEDGRSVAGVERGGRPKVELDGLDLLARGRPIYLATRSLQLTGSSPEVPNGLATARELGYGSNGGGGVRVAAVAQLQLAVEATERPEGRGGGSPSGTRRPAGGLVAAEVGVAGVPSEPKRKGAARGSRCGAPRLDLWPPAEEVDAHGARGQEDGAGGARWTRR